MAAMNDIWAREEGTDSHSAWLQRLPAEITEHILCHPSISHADLANISRTCSTLRDVCLSNEIWKQKIQQRWHHLLDRYERGKSCAWSKEYKNRHLFGLKARSLVHGLSPLYYSWEEISKEGFSDFSAMLDEHPNAAEFLVDELMEIVHGGNRHENLTDRYYAEKVLRYLQQQHLSKKIQKFLELSPEKQHLETGAVLVAQWCQPTENITENEICDKLDAIASDVKTLVAQKHPDHPLLSTQVNADSVPSDLWSCDHSKLVLDCLNTIFYSKYKFQGNKQDYYLQTNSFIDKVLQSKTGIPISLCVIYSCVARRLGLVCEPVNFPSHFLLRWKEHPLQTPDKMYTYIDVFNGGTFIAAEDLSRETNIPASLIDLDTIQVNRPSQVFERMARNLVAIGRQQGRMGDSLLSLRNALELFLLICPDDLDTRLLQVRVNLHLNINLPDVIDSLETIADMDQHRMGLVAYLLNTAQQQMKENRENDIAKPIKPRPRRNQKDVKFSVGLVMQHKRYQYKCVIYGWDAVCGASQEWIVQMGVNNLPKKDQQPFYNVLVEDGSNRYAAQENLDFPEDPTPITHPEVGKYFQEYRGNHYVANNEKRTEYPDDTAVTEQLITGQFG